jgi:hypothetical protein
MKRLLITLSMSFLACLLMANSLSAKLYLKDTLSSSKKIKLGNNPGNIISGGLIVSDSQRIYYVSTGPDDGLYSIKADGSDAKKLSDDYTEYLNLCDGWLYYRKGNTSQRPNVGGLYKMKTDGTLEQRLTTDEPFYINVVNDWIYYVNWSYSTNICRIKTDGTHHEVLYKGHYQCLTTDGSYLYFGKMAGAGTSLLYRGSLSGNEIKQVSTDTIDKFFVYKNWIYYRKDFGRIYRMNTGNFKKELLFHNENFVADSVIPDNNSLYLAGDAGIIKYDIPTKKTEKLFKNRVIQFGLAPDYAYYTTIKFDKNMVRHTKSHLIILNNLKTAPEL